MSRRARLPALLFGMAALAAAAACSAKAAPVKHEDSDSAKPAPANDKDTDREQPSMSATQPLSLELSLSKTSFSLAADRTIAAEVRLTNRGNAPVKVVKRLAIGYQDSLDREVYCEIIRDGTPYTGYLRFQVDYNRPAAAESDIIDLAPMASVSSSFDLQEWYRLAEPGTYTIRAIYEPEAHPSIASGQRVESAPVTVSARP